MLQALRICLELRFRCLVRHCLPTQLLGCSCRVQQPGSPVRQHHRVALPCRQPLSLLPRRLCWSAAATWVLQVLPPPQQQRRSRLWSRQCPVGQPLQPPMHGSVVATAAVAASAGRLSQQTLVMGQVMVLWALARRPQRRSHAAPAS